jgi:hypothetical protein
VVDRKPVQLELERILASRRFRSGQRCRNLLRYVVERTLAGDLQALKERTIGVEVFDRAPDYDTHRDPIVRATACETRKKLAQYYQERASEAAVRIELLTGSYVAEFRECAPPAATPEETPAPAQPGRIGLALGLAATVVLCLSSTASTPGRGRSGLDQLWDPLVNARGAVLICLGSARSPESGPQAYISFGDALCLNRLTSVCARRGKAFQIRDRGAMELPGLADTPSVLIATADDPWVTEALRPLRFTFAEGAVKDRQGAVLPAPDTEHDYAIVARILNAGGGRPIVVAAGLSAYGSIAAGEFLSDPECFREALSKLPAQWRDRNLEIVLRVPVPKRTLGRPEVLATHVW